NQVVNEFNANPTFAGSCTIPSIPPGHDTFSGPNGVILIEGKIARAESGNGQGENEVENNQGENGQGNGNGRGNDNGNGNGKDNRGQKTKGEIWAGDGPIYTPSCAYPGNIGNTSGTLTTPSSVKVLDLKTGSTRASISTGGQARADDLCYNPNSNVVLVTNSTTIDNFITFIDAGRYEVIGKI